MFTPPDSRPRHAVGPCAVVLAGVALSALLLLGPWHHAVAADPPSTSGAPAKPALTVTLTQAERTTWPLSLSATGNVAAWQEASIGAEGQGLRLTEVRVNVGDTVRRGQVLAVFAADTLRADLAQIEASLAEAEATAAAARVDADRARSLQTTGALSAQQIAQYLTAEQTARARLEATKAGLQATRVRLNQTQVLAPDAGVISARSATVGAVIPGGTELFRLIRQGRLEWRAEVPAADLTRVQVGQSVSVVPVGASAPVAGRVRMVGPTVDPTTRNALVYVDLPAPLHGTRAGMFARGEIRLGEAVAWSLPQSAVQLRDGQSHVLVVGADQKVTTLKVSTGRRHGERIELLSALPEGSRVVAAGGAFLGDGDTVKVVQATPAAAPAAAPAAQRATKP